MHIYYTHSSVYPLTLGRGYTNGAYPIICPKALEVSNFLVDFNALIAPAFSRAWGVGVNGLQQTREADHSL